MASTFTTKVRMKPNVGAEVLERDENGALIGAYTGYWSFKRHTVALYPNVRHPFVHWRGRPQKLLVSEKLVLYVGEDKPEVQCVKSQTSKAMKEVIKELDQIKMKV